MSYESYSSTRMLLTNSNVTNYIPSAYIRIGYVKDDMYVPSITITKVDGGTFGKLGYKTAPAGSKLRQETAMFQIDVYHNWSMLSSQKISDEIDKALLSGTTGVGYRKTSDFDNYDENFNCYVKTHRWSYLTHVED